MEGHIAWVLVSTALVLFMTPGLAFFYGGMVRSKNVLGMLMQNFFAMGLIGVLWAIPGNAGGRSHHACVAMVTSSTHRVHTDETQLT